MQIHEINPQVLADLLEGQAEANTFNQADVISGQVACQVGEVIQAAEALIVASLITVFAAGKDQIDPADIMASFDRLTLSAKGIFFNQMHHKLHQEFEPAEGTTRTGFGMTRVGTITHGHGISPYAPNHDAFVAMGRAIGNQIDRECAIIKAEHEIQGDSPTH